MKLNTIFNEMFQKRSTAASSSVTSFLDFGFLNNTTLTAFSSQKALTISAFFNGVDQISNDLAKLPKSIFMNDGTSRLPLPQHPVNYILAASPNDIMTSFDFWKVTTTTVILKGNSFAIIQKGKNSGQQESWQFVEYQDITVFRTDNKLIYKYKGKFIDSANVLHFKGFSLDGVMGIGVISFAAAQLGILLEAQTYAGTVFENRGVGYGVIESDADVNVDNKRKIEEGFVAKMMQKSPFKVPMLDNGMKYKSIAISPAESQFLETNKNGVIEVCRWLNIAPHKLKDLSGATFSNIYQQSIEHVQDSILPWVIRFEQELNRKVFTDSEKITHYTKFNVNFLMRGDLEQRRNYLTQLVYAGIITRNEARAYEDMNPIVGLEEPLQPVNMQALSIANEVNQQQKL